MNLDKLKAHECRFCKSMTDNDFCVRIKEDCRYLYVAEDLRKGLPDLWQLHPDIADTETTDKDYDIDFSGSYKCRLHIHENKITIEAAVTGWGDPVSIDDIDVIEL